MKEIRQLRLLTMLFMNLDTCVVSYCGTVVTSEIESATTNALIYLRIWLSASCLCASTYLLDPADCNVMRISITATTTYV